MLRGVKATRYLLPLLDTVSSWLHEALVTNKKTLHNVHSGFQLEFEKYYGEEMYVKRSKNPQFGSGDRKPLWAHI